MKYIKMTASSNFGNVFSVLVASAFLPFLPMLPLQILVQNLLYDMSQLSIPFDRMDEEYLRKPRKWDAGDIGRFMVWIGPVSSIFDITTFWLMWHVFGANDVGPPVAVPVRLVHRGPAVADAGGAHDPHAARSRSCRAWPPAPVLALTVAIIVHRHADSVHRARQRRSAWCRCRRVYFAWLALTLVCYCVLTQLMKRIYIRRYGRWL